MSIYFSSVLKQVLSTIKSFVSTIGGASISSDFKHMICQKKGTGAVINLNTALTIFTVPSAAVLSSDRGYVLFLSLSAYFIACSV